MNIKINNIAKINNADINIKGITVIAGENNTGKSTIGKALFAFFDALYNVEKKIINDKLSAIQRRIFNNLMHTKVSYKTILGLRASDFVLDEVDINTLYIRLLHIDTKSRDFELELEEILKQYIKVEYQEGMDSDDWNILKKNIIDIINVDYLDSVNQIITSSYNHEFNKQINNIYNDLDGKIDITINKKDIKLVVKSNKVFLEEQPAINIMEDIVYIDDPFVLDEINGKMRRMSELHLDYSAKHRKNLVYQLKNENIENSVEQVLVERKLENIWNTLNAVCPGKFEIGRSYCSYIVDGKELNVKNLSAGLKTFTLFKQLILNGTISQNGIIILDEPEIHLHPEWQLVLAKLIVLLQIEFDLHILLTTHSPYFLNAIEVFSVIYDIADKCNYYLSETNNREVKFINASRNIDKIYAKLAKPLQDLENMRY